MKTHKSVCNQIHKLIKKGGDNFKMIADTLAIELKSPETDYIFFQDKKADLRKDFLNKSVAIKKRDYCLWKFYRRN